MGHWFEVFNGVTGDYLLGGVTGCESLMGIINEGSLVIEIIV